ncbi:coiled-coil domain-containing protein 121 isoform X1 [Electrophorus electricus]|uniref:coiled-coil domain-containing protein 121 isoform X1 n=1 Tax=Electrophorus electricus TaxID=8005 RepID=UPI0015D0CD8A|nr:coiled-coil domain-containing protein 121 isoform X1 [Electrophorus electricus]
MPPKKKGETARKQQDRSSTQAATEQEVQLQKEYKILTETLNTLKMRAEQLRKDNEFLQNEANQTRMESQEYMSYMAKRMQKRRSMIVTLSDQSQQELQELERQREETLQKYEEQANGLKRKILEKENELALLNLEIAELREFKSLQQQQLGRISELEQEVSAMSRRHAESLQALKSDFLKEKERYEAQAEHKVQELTLATNREASRCLLSHMQDVTQENHRLREELQQLIQRAHALHSHQEALQTQHRQLLLEREHIQRMRNSTTDGGSNTKKISNEQLLPSKLDVEDVADCNGA